MQSLEFRVLTTEDIPKIETIRFLEYIRYYGENVDISGLKWNRADQNSVHLGLMSGNTLVSYLRLSFFSSAEKLENTTLFKTPSHIQLPVALLARAATLADFAGQGLHSILRCRALEICMQHGIDTVLGSLEKRSSRLQQLADIGYQVIGTQDSWAGSYLQSKGDVVLIALEGREQIASATQKLKARFDLLPFEESLESVAYL